MKPGAYQADLRVVVQHRAIDISTDGLALALLTQAPSPEGANFREVEAADYARQPIVIDHTGRGRTLCTAETVRFVGVLEWTQPTHLAVAGPDGAVLAYGPLLSSPGPAGVDEAVFAASAIRIRFN